MNERADVPAHWRAFYEELKRRRVIRVATLYVVVCWPIVQIVDILSPALELEASTMRHLLIAFAAGLPVVLALAWLFDLNKEGVVRAADDAGPSAGRALIGRRAEWTIIALLLLVIAVLGYLQIGMSAQPSGGQPLAQTGHIRAIAVLPFQPFSTRVEDEHFCDGLTEELLNVLSRVKGLRVIARTSSFAYKGVAKKVQDIGRELNVDTVLEGSVRRNDVDDRVRITAQLVDVASGGHIWSETFDREFRDVFKIQDEIAAAVVAQLEVTLVAGEPQRLKSRDSASAQAMVAYSLGHTELAKRTADSLEDAARFFERAVEADPNYADAYAGLANAYALQLDYTSGAGTDVLQKAQSAVDSAMRLDPESAAAWAAQGLVYMMQKADDQARTAMRRAIDLNPSNAMANMWYGNLMETAQERYRYHVRAFELDPRSPVAGQNLANDLIEAGREAEAMEIFAKIVDADPNYAGAYRLVGRINEARGRLDEAIRHYQNAYELEPHGPTAVEIASLYVDIGRFDEADAWMARATGLKPDEAQGLLWLRIGSYVARGDRPTAEAQLAPLTVVLRPSVDAHLDAATAFYYLGDIAAIIGHWEAAKRLMEQGAPDANELRMVESAIAAAYAYGESGRREDAEAVLDELERRVEKIDARHGGGHPDIWYVKAMTKAIRGDTGMALIDLQRAVDEGWRQHWRPFVEPCLEDLLEIQNFQSMMAGLAARMDLMREQLELDALSDEQDWMI